MSFPTEGPSTWMGIPLISLWQSHAHLPGSAHRPRLLVAAAGFALPLLRPEVHTDGSGLVQEGRLWLRYILWPVLIE